MEEVQALRERAEGVSELEKIRWGSEATVWVMRMMGVREKRLQWKGLHEEGAVKYRRLCTDADGVGWRYKFL